MRSRGASTSGPPAWAVAARGRRTSTAMMWRSRTRTAPSGSRIRLEITEQEVGTSMKIRWKSMEIGQKSGNFSTRGGVFGGFQGSNEACQGGGSTATAVLQVGGAASGGRDALRQMRLVYRPPTIWRRARRCSSHGWRPIRAKEELQNRVNA